MNNGYTERMVRETFESSDHYDRNERYQFDYEHGQWWVSELATGRQWSVVDVRVAGADSLGFEQVSEGIPD